MQLSDILEENSLKAIGQKTKISEENLDNLFSKKFEKLKRINALGFISIVEREYHADLSALRNEVQEYYGSAAMNESITIGTPITSEKRGKSKFFIFVILLLLGYATWYFLTQFDKKHLSELIPFVGETVETTLKESMNDVVEDLSIAKANERETTENEQNRESEVVAQAMTDDQSVVVAETVMDIPAKTEEVSEVVQDITPEAAAQKTLSIVPDNRLWFGLIDIETGKRDHFSISDAYELDITSKSWLVATSSAPFSLSNNTVTQVFNDAKEHYFRISKEGVDQLTKDEYVALGGWAQW